MRPIPTGPGFRAARRGVTIIEVMAVIAILFLLVAALLIPAVESAREAARRASCVCPLKCMALALHNYASVFGSLPTAGTIRPGNPLDAFSAFVPLLPFLEQHHIANAINFEISPAIQTTVTHAYIRHFATCPSDPKSNFEPSFTVSFDSIQTMPEPTLINYGLNLGTWKIYDPAEKRPGNGAFTFDIWFRLADFTDGTSTTIAVAEGTSYQHVFTNRGYPSLPDARTPASPAEIAAYGGRFAPGAGHISWAVADPLQTGLTINFPPNTFVPVLHRGKLRSVDFLSMPPGASATVPSFAVIRPRSHHPNGVNATMMDGSVRFIRNTIAMPTFRALGTRAGGEKLSEDAF